MNECNQCGKCCIKYGNGGLSATKQDIEDWELYHPEVFSFVSEGQIWMDPETETKLDYCPWLSQSPDGKKYTCDIYDIRPEDCRQYPVLLSDMITDACEMLEEKDLADPRRAQRKLKSILRIQ